ncbi:hypothetical protein VNO78_20476 [Psophocarpus tetragonolobus]|uniref:Uncharacterized protein n=1 Tax=Psophocarpus tetragonolobus TaxID=3891 RepID=A0AAN9XH67_PSOTE
MEQKRISGSEGTGFRIHSEKKAKSSKSIMKKFTRIPNSEFQHCIWNSLRRGYVDKARTKKTGAQQKKSTKLVKFLNSDPVVKAHFVCFDQTWNEDNKVFEEELKESRGMEWMQDLGLVGVKMKKKELERQ